jgi:Stress responsive A/B Barrel Domain
MLRHIALLKWTDRSIVDEAQLGEDFAALEDKLPYLLSMQSGADLGFADTNFDYAVVAHFVDEAGWRQYQASPEHLKIARAIAPNLASRVAAQIEMRDN